MKKYRVGVLAVLAFGLTAGIASATPTLYDYGFNINGTVTYGAAPAGVSMVGDFDLTAPTPATGLGTISWSTSGLGFHSFFAFFDHEIDETVNTYYNEYGVSYDAPGAGQSWEIDEPGFVFGDIYDHLLAGTLDNTNGVPAATPDDVSWAMGWDFNLAAGETADITLSLTQIAPGSGFFLQQYDPDSQESIFFASTLTIRGGGGTEPIPEPATMLLMGTGLAGLFGLGRKRMKKS
ncbi:MAG: PEP-CTERM sorting domain-containing protein [Deltaproteobacteria bacterium]|nr:PEP-CTERM sorting domain-containing protein [Deltaproteobacteria bacterium]